MRRCSTPRSRCSAPRPIRIPPELQIACVTAYNNWLTDFCAHDARRLYGLAVIPTVGIDSAVAELERALKQNLRGVILSRYPNGSFDPADEDDRFWARMQEADLPAHVHIGGFIRPSQLPSLAQGRRFMGVAGASKSGASVIPIAVEFLFSGLLDKFPRLNVVLVEGNIGWIPTVLEQTDDMFLRFRFFADGEGMKMLPSEYFYRNLWSTFMVDTHGMANRYKCNIDKIMWSTDYPHTGTDWPNSRVTLERNFRGLPYDEVKKMVHDNARGLYKMDVPAVVPA